MEITPIIKILLAALSGTFIARMLKPGLPLTVFLSTMLSSALMAYFIAMPIAEALGNENYGPVIGVFIGIFGLTICEAILKTIKETDWSGIIKSRLGADK